MELFKIAETTSKFLIINAAHWLIDSCAHFISASFKQLPMSYWVKNHPVKNDDGLNIVFNIVFIANYDGK